MLLPHPARVITHLPALRYVLGKDQCHPLLLLPRRRLIRLSLVSLHALSRVSEYKTYQDNKQPLGNGPSALILSYILHGHVPRYVGRHPDDNLHQALGEGRDLLSFDPEIFDHLRSSLKYSSQALPVNVLLDTLLRPNGDVSDLCSSCIEWINAPENAVDHVVLGDSSRAGGQWADNSTVSSSDIGTLSYAEQLSLPGYTFADYWQQTTGHILPELVRPSRTDVANYYTRYPEAVGIADKIRLSEYVNDVSRNANGFHIGSHDISCKYLILATGTFNVNLPPPRSLAPLASVQASDGPLLVIGSGFTAADIIISASPGREILHVYNWDPQSRPSPLKGCHSQAYPEYAWIYKQMKLAAMAKRGSSKGKSHSSRIVKAKGLSSLPNFNQRDWAATYHGFPNGKAVATLQSAPATDESASPDGAQPQSDRVSITLPTSLSHSIHTVGTLQYAAGRRGTLSYLTPTLLSEALNTSSIGTSLFEPSSLPKLTRLASYASSAAPDVDPWTGETDIQHSSPSSAPPSRNISGAVTPIQSSPYRHLDATISGQAFRAKIEETSSMEVAPNVYVIGSLTGDSLVRFAFGGCCVVAGRILGDLQEETSTAGPAFTNGASEIKGNDLSSGPKAVAGHVTTSCASTIHHPSRNDVIEAVALANGTPGTRKNKYISSNRCDPMPQRAKACHGSATQHLSRDGATADFHSQEHQRRAFPLDRRKSHGEGKEHSGGRCCVQ